MIVEKRRRGSKSKSSLQSEQRSAMARSRVKWDDADTKQGDLSYSHVVRRHSMEVKRASSSQAPRPSVDGKVCRMHDFNECRTGTSMFIMF